MHPNSASIISHIGLGSRVHADFAGSSGSGAQTVQYGIPFHVVDSSKGQAMVPVGGLRLVACCLAVLVLQLLLRCCCSCWNAAALLASDDAVRHACASILQLPQTLQA